MKTLTRTALFIGMIIALNACSATNQLTLSVKEPEKISIPDNVTRVGLINRSKPSEANKPLDQIDKVLSLEGLQLDELGSTAALNGLKTQLERTGRFKTVTLINGDASIQKGLGIFPAQLSWEQVETICKINQVDLLFSLEYYDTNAAVKYDQQMVSIPNPFGVPVNIPGHKVTISTVLANGWRVYDPHAKYILDETVSNNNLVNVGEGINPFKAVEAVNGRKEAVIQLSNNLGNSYGLNITPVKRRVTREYYVKGTNNFEIAKRRAQTGDWDGAAQLWEQELNNPKSKIAGRAYYNMAIINEINGNLDEAVSFASKSYTDYNNKDALRYVKILKYRLSQDRLLQ